MIKSGLRVLACGYLLYGNFIETAIIFAIAEIIGILEEF